MSGQRGSYVPAPARGDCPSGKVQYASRKQARRDASRIAGRIGVFNCPDCDWFHLGHLPQRVRNGEIDKPAWQAAIGGSR